MSAKPTIVIVSGAIQLPLGQLSDRELVALIASGDHDAFAEICRRYERRLIRIAFRVTGNLNDAEDVVQEAFIKAYKNFSCFRFDAALGTWLTQIVINCGLMELRRQKRRVCLSLDEANENGVPWTELLRDFTVDVDETVSLRERVELLTKCAARLPPKLRSIIEAYLLTEPSMKELASSQAISVAAAKTRLLRARAMIKDSSLMVAATRRGSHRPPASMVD